MDHRSGDVYLVALHDRSLQDTSAGAWLDAKEALLQSRLSTPELSTPATTSSSPANGSLNNHHQPQIKPPDTPPTGPATPAVANGVPSGSSPDKYPVTAGKAAVPPPFRLCAPRKEYIANVEACLQALHDGESYELCLTTALVRRDAPEPFQLYKALRRLNPAPYAAWFAFGADGPRLCCSSPERFLRGERGGLLEARPIKVIKVQI